MLIAKFHYFNLPRFMRNCSIITIFGDSGILNDSLTRLYWVIKINAVSLFPTSSHFVHNMCVVIDLNGPPKGKIGSIVATLITRTMANIGGINSDIFLYFHDCTRCFQDRTRYLINLDIQGEWEVIINIFIYVWNLRILQFSRFPYNHLGFCLRIPLNNFD